MYPWLNNMTSEAELGQSKTDIFSSTVYYYAAQLFLPWWGGGGGLCKGREDPGVGGSLKIADIRPRNICKKVAFSHRLSGIALLLF